MSLGSGARHDFLRPLFGAEGDVSVHPGAEADLYRRGDVEVSGRAGDVWIYELVSCLVRWESWLRRARVGTLRWLAAQNGQLSAGCLDATTSVRSQLLRAELVGPSDLWGDATSPDCYRLRFWARLELERRAK